NWSEAFRIAIPFVLGDNIGTTITAQIAAIQSNASGKRAAMAHSLFNVTGVVIMLPLVYFGLYSRAIEAVVPFEITKLTIGVFIAISHSTFNVIAALIVLPFVGTLEKIVLRILPIRKEELELRPVTLEEHLLDTPALAMQQIRREMVRMAKTARSATELAIDALQEDNPKRLKDVYRKEEATDNFQTEITRYLVALSTRPLETHFSNEIPVLLHNVNDIERIGDHAINIAESATRKIDKKFTFGQEANEEITRMREQVGEMCDNVIQAIQENDTAAAAKALENEGAINEMLNQFRRNHVHRLSDGTCKPLAGLVFVDTIQNLEKIGDHLANVAQGVLSGGEWTGQLQMQAAAEPQPDTETDEV
ncbi:MAG: Na/Pi symporter, partial [Phycisphaerae bacterium]|nr:Na/Pi symporter [Phycisphaerae bacterium]